MKKLVENYLENLLPMIAAIIGIAIIGLVGTSLMVGSLILLAMLIDGSIYVIEWNLFTIGIMVLYLPSIALLVTLQES